MDELKWNIAQKKKKKKNTPWSEPDGLMVPDTTPPPAVLHFFIPHTTRYGPTGRIGLKQEQSETA